jgi:hypothetical protein
MFRTSKSAYFKLISLGHSTRELGTTLYPRIALPRATRGLPPHRRAAFIRSRRQPQPQPLSLPFLHPLPFLPLSQHYTSSLGRAHRCLLPRLRPGADFFLGIGSPLGGVFLTPPRAHPETLDLDLVQ